MNQIKNLPEVDISVLNLQGRKPSKYQTDIFKFIKYGSGNAIVNATAGSGKSSTLHMAYGLIDPRKNVRFLAFNKHVETDLSGKGLPAKTMHAEGFAAWRNHVQEKIQLDDNKLMNIIRGRKSIPVPIRFPLRNLIQKAKISGLAPGNKEGMMADTYDSWFRLSALFNIDFPEGCNDDLIISEARAVLQESNEQKAVIDFADMIYLPLIYNSKMPQYDLLFVDELQDLNPLQHNLISRMISPEGRFIGVGDRFQSMYGFAGADMYGIDKAMRTFKAVELPLSISYRCPKKVVNMAKLFVPHIEAAPWAIDGEIEYKDVALETIKFLPSDAILCRNNAPLVKTAYSLLRNKVPCKMLGRDIGKGVISLIKKQEAKTIPRLEAKLRLWLEKEIIRATKADANASTEYIEDRYDTAMAFVENTKHKTPDDIIAEIEVMFADEDVKGVTSLSSVHKYKGMGADNIYILNPALFGAAQARAKNKDQMQQEKNIQYVAYTRTQKKLCFLNPTR